MQIVILLLNNILSQKTDNRSAIEILSLNEKISKQLGNANLLSELLKKKVLMKYLLTLYNY